MDSDQSNRRETESSHYFNLKNKTIKAVPLLLKLIIVNVEKNMPKPKEC